MHGLGMSIKQRCSLTAATTDAGYPSAPKS